MARSYNRVILLGNVGADPETRPAGGTTVTRVSLATTRTWKDKQTGEMREDTAWHRLTIWGRGGEIVQQYVKKGEKLFIEGYIKYSSSGEGESKKYFTDVIVDEFVLLGGRGGAGGEQGGGGAPRGAASARPAAAARPAARPANDAFPDFPAGLGADDEEDDLPF